MNPKSHVKVVEGGGLALMPPHPSKCQTCAADHDPNEPHDKTSIYYQMRFRAEHGRWPTWEDAMAHCDEEMKGLWRETLREFKEIE